MRGGPTPGTGRTPDPTGGEIFRVSYRTRRGETFSKLFRYELAARRFAQIVLNHGGDPRFHRVHLSGWREDHPCGACEYQVFGHSHSNRG